MIFFIHYRPDDGEILGWGNGFEPTPIDGMAVALFDEPFDPDPQTQKFDGEAVIDKTAAETRQARLPTLIEVQQAIWMELARTDQFMLADRNIEGRDDWAGYRQMLRDLSKRFDDPADMIDAWQLPPDGTDPIPDLRARL